MRTAIFSGSFDPITLGHLDIIRRASAIFDQVVVCVMVNSAKSTMFTAEERLEMINLASAGLSNVKAEFYGGLAAEYVKLYPGSVIIKGLRSVTDFEYELPIAYLNGSIGGRPETLFLTSAPEYAHISSSFVRELLKYSADISGLAPPEILDVLQRKMESGC